jgi:DNA-directed RNA polymerase subunit M/transcription elongation factor TFIIS
MRNLCRRPRAFNFPRLATAQILGIIPLTMDTIDVSREWSRLQELYAGMAEEELAAVAEDGYDLTDIAKQALRAEISRRGLDIALNEVPPSPEADIPERLGNDFDAADLDLVTEFRVWDVAEARRVKQALDAAFIPAYFGPGYIEKVDLLPPISEAGIEVRVRKSDRERARAAARDSLSPDAGSEKDVEYVVRCPKCHSEEIVLQSFEPDPSGDESPFNSTYHWSCDACGHTWQDDGVRSPT